MTAVSGQTPRELAAAACGGQSTEAQKRGRTGAGKVQIATTPGNNGLVGRKQGVEPDPVAVLANVDVDVVDETVIVVDVLGITEVEINCEVEYTAKVAVSRVVVDTNATDRVETAVAAACKVTVIVIGDIVETAIDIIVLVNDRLVVSWFVMSEVDVKVVDEVVV